MREWQQYEQKFRTRAIAAGFADDYINYCLSYAMPLFQRRLPIIYDQQHLSLLVGYDLSYLRRASNSPRSFYRFFAIPKKSGGVRTIAEPLPSLKEIQRWILCEILDNGQPSKFAKAYVPKKSIKENARFHIAQELVLTIDIRDFFPSIRYPKVFSVFKQLGYVDSVATMLANLCCLKNSLPQGAPTSPAISNIVLTDMDNAIGDYTRTYGIRYTRYADDMTFSGSFKPGIVIKHINKMLQSEGFRTNWEKIRVRQAHERQEVTGIVVNEKLSVPRELKRKIRQAIYYIEKYGLASHLAKTENLRANYVRHLQGLIQFALFVNPHDQELQEYKVKIREYLPEL